MNSVSSQVSMVPLPLPPPHSDSPFWELISMLAEEPDLGWLGWVLRQREGAANQGMDEAAVWHAEATTPRSRSRPNVGASFLQEEPAAAEDEAPPCGEATGEQHNECNDCHLERSQASCYFGPRPLEALRLLEHSAHPRIWKTYRVGLSRFLAFREEAGLPSAWPIPIEQISGFLVAMDSQHRSSPKILGFLAGLSYISRLFHFPDPLQDFFISRMAITLNRQGDIQRRGWTPLSLEMLQCLVGVLDSVCTTLYNRILFRAAFLLAWFAALRPEEIVPEDATSLDPALLHLSDFELSEDNIRIQLRVLGVGPERFALCLTQGKEPRLCPVVAISNYLEVRPRREGPLFVHGNGEPLTRGQFLAVLDPTLRLLGLLPQQFGLHSFWLGAIITAVKHRLPDDLILRLARWPNRGNP